MELVKKATILFPPDMYAQLSRVARQRQTSVGALVRDACRAQYGLSTPEVRRKALAELAALSLPVCSPEQMERESVPAAKSLP